MAQQTIGIDTAEGMFRPGDRVLIPQGMGEPQALTAALVAASLRLEGLTACVGMVTGEALLAESRLRFESYGIMGRMTALPAERIDVLTLPYSGYIDRIVTGALPADVVFLRLSPARGGRYHLGIGDLHLIDAARRARVVLAEISADVPRTSGTLWPEEVPFLAVDAEGALAELHPGSSDETEMTVARHVAALVPDGAVIQLGIGRLPQAVTAALMGHRDLGLHSGAMIDGVADLVEAGAITNARKEVDAGVSVAGVLMGSRRIARFADGNPALRLAPTGYTHAAQVLARLSRFHAINSAIEVDLFGRINLERAAARPMAGLGGQPDFARAARASAGGRSIVALPSTAARGSRSRIVAEVAHVSLPHAAADVVVTEWGAAHLAGVPPEARGPRLIAIADPRFRDVLERAWSEQKERAHAL
ncbi:acetyl-CoA hydrolase/transferase family protein [Haematobacter genomosp. 1]|uniref:Acetyl-CoA hydrolase/transferase C-terminal domain-containing protein n=1 Tax=Haematobacter genomosp. 1 TaxID=366618 RepID=A0A212AE95_9RHOB|nr:acetyl-CoA hydrolase/transferase C-terminal domain-containing protein [Haematobacter genomosp. 1]OWJ79634.1 hypothetical protein CDV49_04780 [Haematobacter genomosp. 1]